MVDTLLADGNNDAGLLALPLAIRSRCCRRPEVEGVGRFDFAAESLFFRCFPADGQPHAGRNRRWKIGVPTMAVAARPSAGGAFGLKVALVVFVCVALASLTFTVILYTQHEDMTARSEEAAARESRAVQDKRAVQQALAEIGQSVTGEQVEEAAKLKQAIASARQEVVGDAKLAEAKIAADAPLLMVLKTLHAQFDTQGALLEQVTSDRDGLKGKLAELQQAAETRESGYTAKTEELEKRYSELEQQNVTARDEWNKQVADLTAKLESAAQAASGQLANERQLRKNLEQQLAKNEQRINELNSKLESFRMSGDPLALLQNADGQVVRVVPSDNLAYINLGSRDGVKRGMTFEVYSRLRGIPANGRGKGSIQIVNVYDTTSECKTTTSTPGDPLMENDLIANPVYDRTRSLNFAVVGDFDLNFDGRVDDVDGNQVAALIQQMGGNVVTSVDTRTDFLVAGNPPPPVGEKSDSDGDDAAARERRAEHAAAAKVFDEKLAQAKALSIPVLTRSQFLSFMGTGVPGYAPEDASPR